MSCGLGPIFVFQNILCTFFDDFVMITAEMHYGLDTGARRRSGCIIHFFFLSFFDQHLTMRRERLHDQTFIVQIGKYDQFDVNSH